ncbi:hypothetical protein ABIA23_004524 [Sinorhizobium fredii]
MPTPPSKAARVRTHLLRRPAADFDTSVVTLDTRSRAYTPVVRLIFATSRRSVVICFSNASWVSPTAGAAGFEILAINVPKKPSSNPRVTYQFLVPCE